MFRGCSRKILCCKKCQRSRTEKLYDAGRQFYINEISVSRLVHAMHFLEKQNVANNGGFTELAGDSIYFAADKAVEMSPRKNAANSENEMSEVGKSSKGKGV